MSTIFPSQLPGKSPTSAIATTLHESLRLPIGVSDLQRTFFAEMLTLSRVNAAEPTPKWSPSLDDVNHIPKDIIEIGAIYISVNNDPTANLQIACLCQWTVDDHGTRITQTETSMNDNYQLIADKSQDSFTSDEKRTLVVLAHPRLRSSYMSYYRLCTNIGIHMVSDRLHHIGAACDLVSRGSCWWLKRRWAISGFVGMVEAYMMTNGGRLTRVRFTCDAMRRIRLNGQEIEVVIIRQWLLLPDEYAVETSMAFYSTSGRLIRLEFQKHGQRMVAHSTTMADFGVHIVDGDATWLRAYIDLKTIRRRQLKEYVNRTRMVDTLIRDFVKTLLLVKPRDVLTFSEMYFGRFSDKQN